MVDKRRYYPLITTAVTSVLILSMVGIGTLMGWLPMPRSTAASYLGKVITGSEDVSHVAMTECSNCGAIESIKSIALQYQPPVFGSLVGGAGGGVYLVEDMDKEARNRTIFHVVVRMDDGSHRILHSVKRHFFVGENVKIIRDEIIPILSN
jgi:outer membrane lipoprotein SlyB